MRRKTQTLTTVLGTIAVGCVSVAWLAGAAPAQQTERTRVGTFRRAEVLVAYYGSTVHDQMLRELIKQRDEAKAAGKEDQVKELEARGAAMQDVAHKQLAGEAMFTNVLEHLKPKLAEVARQANVRLIVEQPLFHDSTVELIDVTDLLVQQFDPAKNSARPDRGQP